jgi:hypothetical protein
MEEVTLSNGDSHRVSFQVPADIIGQFEVNIDNLSANYVVKEPFLSVKEDDTSDQLQISSFDVTPIFELDTGKLVAAKIVYELNKNYDMISGERLWLKVFQEEDFMEVIPLLDLSQFQPDSKIGEVYYVPSQGWRVGKYSFQAALYRTTDESLLQTTLQEHINVTPETITQVVSWKMLGIVIGNAFLLSMVILAIVLYRRRDMLYR